jgi:hypothetical protein
VFENKFLRSVCRPRRNEVTVSCIELYNEQLHNSYSSPVIIRMIMIRNEMGRASSTNGREDIQIGFLGGWMEITR